MADLILAEQMLAYLIAQGLVRDPSTTGSPPPCWTEKLEGVPVPTTTDPLVAALYTGPEIAMPTFEDKITQRPLKIITRCADWPTTEVFHKRIRAVLEEKRHFMAGALLVQRSKMAIGIQRVPDADPTLYQATQSFRIQAFVSDTTV